MIINWGLGRWMHAVVCFAVYHDRESTTFHLTKMLLSDDARWDVSITCYEIPQQRNSKRVEKNELCSS